MERFQAGDSAAFDTLYSRYFQRLVRFCHKRVGDPLEAEEIAQEAFTKALRALPAFQGERRFYPWMTVIAGRLCVDAHRRRGRTEPSPSVDLGVVEGGQEKIIDLVDIEILRTAMVQLGPRHRDVLDLREVQGWSYQAIADHYGVNLGTVEALLFRARKALKREFMAVVATDRNWAAVPLIGFAVRRLAAWRTRLEALSTALPSLSGPGVVAAVVAVTAVTGIMAAGVMGGSGEAPAAFPPAAPATISNMSDGPTVFNGPDAAPLGSDRLVDAAGQAGPDRGTTYPTPPSPGVSAAAPIAEAAPGVHVFDGAQASSSAREMPFSADAGPVVVGVSPERATGQLAQTIEDYRAEVGR